MARLAAIVTRLLLDRLRYNVYITAFDDFLGWFPVRFIVRL